MKTVIFLIFIALVIFGIFWNSKKAQAKAEAARLKSRDVVKKHQKEAMTQDYEMIWPVVIRPDKNQKASGANSNSGHPEEEKSVEEPLMTAIEYIPPEKQVG